MSDCDENRPATADELAEALRISRAHAYKMIDEGTIKAIRLGRTLRIPRAEVNRLLAGEVQPAA